jgi:hypothetical protein
MRVGKSMFSSFERCFGRVGEWYVSCVTHTKQAHGGYDINVMGVGHICHGGYDINVVHNTKENNKYKRKKM